MQPRTLEEALYRIEELERLLDAKPSRPPLWRTTKMEWKILHILLSRDLARHDALFTLLYGGDSERGYEIIKVYVCKLRRKLAWLGVQIHVQWGEGYYMTKEDKEKVQRAMENEYASNAASVAA